MQVETLAGEEAVDPIQWAEDRIDRLFAAGAHGRLYVFIRDPIDPGLAGVLDRAAAAPRRLHPYVVAPGDALSSRQHLELLQRAGVRAVYLTLYGATAAHDTTAGDVESLRRVVLLLRTAPRITKRVRVGVHVALSPQAVRQLPGIFRLLAKLGDSAELLLWFSPDGREWDARAALPALDFAVTTAAKLGIPIVPVGFEGARGGPVPGAGATCVASGAVVELLRDGIPLPSASGGLFATAGSSAPLAESASTGQAVRQLGFELAASRRPFLDLPACLGGPPPVDAVAASGCVKVDACRACPIDASCPGVPRPMLDIPGLREQVAPPRHWLATKEHARVLVACEPVSDVYGTTFFSLARWLARFGARVDVVTPWAVHEDVGFAWPEVQRAGRPDGTSELERFMLEGPVERYDLIITPDPRVTRPLVVSRRLPPTTRLVVTDFHMLRGMDDWVRDFCPPGRRAEEGGWWPSPEIELNSGFPGFASLYTRYGIPMQQVAWQPYVLDAASFAVQCAAEDGVSIVSGGNHRRDVDTLLAAAARLDDRLHRIDLFAHGELRDVPRTIDFHGVVPAATYCRAVGRSRFMIVPLLDHPHNAAGITAIVTAIICGRPAIATATAATRDYIIDGVSGLLVPPGDAQALADAIERVDRDPALLACLAAGAREAAHHYTTESWARALLFGSGTTDRAHWMWSQWRRASGRS